MRAKKENYLYVYFRLISDGLINFDTEYRSPVLPIAAPENICPVLWGDISPNSRFVSPAPNVLAANESDTLNTFISEAPISDASARPLAALIIAASGVPAFNSDSIIVDIPGFSDQFIGSYPA